MYKRLKCITNLKMIKLVSTQPKNKKMNSSTHKIKSPSCLASLARLQQSFVKDCSHCQEKYKKIQFKKWKSAVSHQLTSYSTPMPVCGMLPCCGECWHLAVFSRDPEVGRAHTFNSCPVNDHFHRKLVDLPEARNCLVS